jgi:glycosyltransferase involved in cell wall biosynthesis
MLRDLLDALASQTLGDFEVIVVDDGSSDGSGDEASGASANGLRIRVERTSGVGAVEARRRGVAASRGTFLAFTDSDCAPDPAWLAAGVAALEAGADMAAGSTVPARPVQALERSVHEPVDDGLYATCNVFYRRDAYERAGGFTDAGRRLGVRAGRWTKGLGFGEDTLLAWRVRRAGRGAFVPEAVVRHAVMRPSVREMIRRAWLAGAFPGLVRDVPELRRMLLRGRIWLGTRRVPVYALVVCGALPWRVWLAPAAGAWWVLARVLQLWRSPGSAQRRLAAVPVEMTIDVVTAASLLAGSVRARTLVL